DVTFGLDQFRHIDHGYAVTSHSSQGQTVNRVLVNAETIETDLLLNQRMAYVAISRARFEARIYTDSLKELGPALNREKNKEIALEALKQTRFADNNEHRASLLETKELQAEQEGRNLGLLEQLGRDSHHRRPEPLITPESPTAIVSTSPN